MIIYTQCMGVVLSDERSVLVVPVIANRCHIKATCGRIDQFERDRNKCKLPVACCRCAKRQLTSPYRISAAATRARCFLDVRLHIEKMSMSVAPSSSDVSTARYFIQVSKTMPTLQECYDFVNDPACGAVSTFIGTTRDNFDGKIVTKLSYEGYVPMAEKELRKLCDCATEKYAVHKIAAVHILGDCPVGTASVILACSSAHRRDSLRCCEYLIDELKARVPIWKREVYEGDSSVWKENVEWNEGKRQRVMVKSNNGEDST